MKDKMVKKENSADKHSIGERVHVFFSKLFRRKNKNKKSVQEKHSLTLDEKLQEETHNLFFNSLILENIRKYNGGRQERNCLLTRIQSEYDYVKTNCNDNILDILSYIRKIGINVIDFNGCGKDQVLFSLVRENEKLRSKINDTTDNAKMFLKNVFLSYSVFILSGGFLWSCVVYHYIHVDLSILFDFNDYFGFGMAKFMRVFLGNLTLIIWSVAEIIGMRQQAQQIQYCASKSIPYTKTMKRYREVEK